MKPNAWLSRVARRLRHFASGVPRVTAGFKQQLGRLIDIADKVHLHAITSTADIAKSGIATRFHSPTHNLNR